MKHLTHSLTIVILITLISLAFLGCEQESLSNQRGSVTIHLALGERLLSRTIMPAGDAPLTISYYTITGTGPSEQTLSVTTSNAASSVTLDNLLVGNWSFIATAYNDTNKALATGTIEEYIIKNDNTIDFPLTQVVGNGNIDLSFTWNTHQVHEGSTFNFALYNETNTEITAPDYTIEETTNMMSGTSKVEIEALPAGFYRVEASLVSNGVQIAGFSESIRLIDGTTSSATVAFIIGKVINDIEISIIDNTDSPILGSIIVNPTAPTVNQTVTLTYNATLPNTIEETDLTYSWFIDGVKVESQTTKVLTINALAGTTRYDVVVGKVDGLYSLGSESTSISITPSPAISTD